MAKYFLKDGQGNVPSDRADGSYTRSELKQTMRALEPQGGKWFILIIISAIIGFIYFFF